MWTPRQVTHLPPVWDLLLPLHLSGNLHLGGKGAAVLAEGLSGAVASGLGKVRYLN